MVKKPKKPNRPKEPVPEPARDPASAWRRIVKLGGLEPDGRDRDFVDLVRAELQPSAPDIGSALAACANNETLIRAIFGVVAPFSAMSRDIIDFMRRAGARRGKASVQIVIEETVLGLEAFEEFVAAVRRAPGVVEVADATISDAFELANAIRIGSAGAAVPSDVARWLDAFGRGHYLDLPGSLRRSWHPGELAEVAAIATTALGALRSIARTRTERGALVADRAFPAPDSKVADPVAVAHVEHDLVGPLIGVLGQAAELPEAGRAEVAAAVAPILARIPRRPVLTTGEAAVLEKVLSLPAWKKRHELYAVWIATRIAAAVQPDRVTVHPDQKGDLPFDFRPTHLMTIESADGPKSLWAERRIKCANPVGEGRTEHVQPDFGLWSGSAGADRCDLVVEVKHYKTPALKTFGAALVDYAAAHPEAETVLVNYGRAAGVADHERWSDYRVIRRCREVGELTPFNRAACEAFAKLVRGAAGPQPHPDVLMLDVSGSTREEGGRLRMKRVAQSWLRDSMQAHIRRVVAAEDDVIIWDLPRLDAADRLDDPIQGGGGDPVAVARALLCDSERIWIATDSSGFTTFRGSKFAHFKHVRHVTGIDILEVGRS